MKNLKLLISAIVLFLSVNTYGQTIIHKKKVKIQDSLVVNGNVKTTGTLNGTSAIFTGNVGIGTTSPDVELEVIDASPTDGVIADFVNSANAGGTTAAIKLSNSDAESCDVILGANRAGANFGSDFSISLSDGVDGSNQERFRITEDGNVGIGTTNPSDKLHVNGTFRSNAFWTNSSLVSYWGDGTTAYGGLTWSTGYATVFSQAGNVLRLGAGGTSPDMTITTSGNVGIGTTNPSEKLDVNGNAKANKFITGQLEINSTANATNIVSDDENLYIKNDHASGNVRLLADAAIYLQTGSNEDLALTASSSSGVGLWHIGSKKIGTTNTGASVTGNLEVSGTVFSETNKVDVISGTTSSSTIGANYNVIVVDTSVDCTLTISTSTNIASIKVINIGDGNVYFSAGASVTVNDNGAHIGVASSNKVYFSSTLTKIATNSWIISE